MASGGSHNQRHKAHTVDCWLQHERLAETADLAHGMPLLKC